MVRGSLRSSFFINKGIKEAITEMSFSSNNLSDIKFLYESIAHGEVENLHEKGVPPTPEQAAAFKQQQARDTAVQKMGGPLGAGGGQAAMKKLQSQGVSPRSAYAQVYSQGEKNIASPKFQPGAKPAATPAATPAAAKPATTPAARPAATTPAVKPAPTTTPAAKPAATPPAAKTAPAASSGTPMQQWAKANPTLAMKVKPGQSGYGDIQKQLTTSAFTAKSSAVPTSQAIKSAGDTYGSKAFSSPTSGASAFKTPTSMVSATNTAAASPTTGTTAFKPAGAPPTPTERTATGSVKPGSSYAEEYDAYDIVLEYLLDAGHAETIAEAQYIMTELDEETINEIAHGTGKRVMPSAKKRSALAKRARAGEDIGKKGKGFKAVAKKAAKQYDSEEAGERVAAAAMFKAQAKKG